MADFSGGPKAGHKMKLYRNTGTHDTPVWGEIDEIADVTVDGLELGIAELKRRASNWTKGLATIFGMFTVGFRYIHGLNTTIFTALRTDFFAQTVREYAVMNGDIEDDGIEGLRLPALHSAFPWDQPLEDVSGHDMTLTHAYMSEDGTEIDPEWLVIEGSA